MLTNRRWFKFRSLVALGTCTLTLGGCASVPMRGDAAETSAVPQQQATTGRVFSVVDVRTLLPMVQLGDDAYAEVNSEWLRRWYPQFRAELFRLGVTKWDSRFDCKRFAEFYTSLAQAHFYRASFHSRTSAKALALGTYWYIRADGKGGHAIVQALTERGRIFFEPQTGAEIILTPAEQVTLFPQFF